MCKGCKSIVSKINNFYLYINSLCGNWNFVQILYKCVRIQLNTGNIEAVILRVYVRKQGPTNHLSVCRCFIFPWHPKQYVLYSTLLILYKRDGCISSTFPHMILFQLVNQSNDKLGVFCNYRVTLSPQHDMISVSLLY